MPLSDLIVFCLLVLILFFIFYLERSAKPFWRRFFYYVPGLFLCYFIPSLLTLSGLYDPADSQLYWLASRVFLPMALFLFTLSINLPKLRSLGPKALLAFLAGTLGIVIGGPLALLLVQIGFDLPAETWRGLSTIAGSWIGGGANQLAMKAIFKPSDELFTICVTVDIIMANFWLAFLLYLQKREQQVNQWLKAEGHSSSFVEAERQHIQINFDLMHLLRILAPAFMVLAMAHLLGKNLADYLGANYPILNRFSLSSGLFWMVVISTTAGLVASQTKLRKLSKEGGNALAKLFLYLMIAIIGLQMDLSLLNKIPMIALIGFIWLMVHIIVLFLAGKLFRIPLFYLAVGSQANIGGAASAPVVASAFHSSLAPIGVLMAVAGYGLGTYAAWLCALLMSMLSR